MDWLTVRNQECFSTSILEHIQYANVLIKKIKQIKHTKEFISHLTTYNLHYQTQVGFIRMWRCLRLQYKSTCFYSTYFLIQNSKILRNFEFYL